MTDTARAAATAKPPLWFWIVSILSLLWLVMACAAYLMQVRMSPEDLAKMDPAQATVWALMPAWVFGAYAVAVWGGLVASVGLLVRRRWARPLFVVSLAAALIQFGWAFLVSPLLETVGPSAIPFPAFIIAVAAVMVWFSDHGVKRGWLR